MGKRIKIGIIYSYDERWIGGTYYYQNLIQSLNLLPDVKKPHLVILSNDFSSFDSIKIFNYPFISYKELSYKLSFFERVKKKIWKIIFQKNINYNRVINFGIDVLFHPSEVEIPNTVKKHLYWIPDFQELHLPHLFSQKYLDYRKETQLKLLSNDKHVLFSSNDAYNDFKKIYPDAKTNNYIVNFTVFHPQYSDIEVKKLKEKYQLEDVGYFFSPNQFWKHKNHIVVLKAVKRIKELYNLNFQVLFSGKELDPRNPTYFDELKQFVEVNNLQDNVKFLGFIDRREQLCFMKKAIAIIQPSLFEGWSSVVEDVKAMDQNIIVSLLAVHKEQLAENAYYFDPDNEIELVNHMVCFLSNNIQRPSFRYQENLHLFGEKFLNVILEIK